MQEESLQSDKNTPTKLNDNDFFNNDTKIEGKSMFNQLGKSDSNEILVIIKKMTRNQNFIDLIKVKVQVLKF